MRLGTVLVRPDVVDIKDVDARQPETLQTVLPGAHDPVIRIVVDRIEQRLVVSSDDLLDIPRVGQWRQLIGQDQPHGRAPRTSQALRRNPLPRGTMS